MGKMCMPMTIISNSPVRQVPENYMPKDAGAWFELKQGPDSGKKMFYYDFQVGQGTPQRTIVLVHGNPESSYTFAKTRSCVEQILKQYAKQTVRIVAMDHIGFGLSDQASFEMVDMHHAANLQQLIQHLDLQQVTLVIHDWGGAIGIGAFMFDPLRVRAMVLMNTTVFPVPLTGMTYKNFPFSWLAWNHLGFYVPGFLWRYVSPMVMFSPAGKWAALKHFAHFVARAFLGRLTSDETFYLEAFSPKMNALSSKRNVKQTRVWGHGYEYKDAQLGPQSNVAFFEKIQRMIPREWAEQKNSKQTGIKVRAFFGEFDPLARDEIRQQWLANLPQLAGHMTYYSDAGHFVEETKYADIAQGICSITLD